MSLKTPIKPTRLSHSFFINLWTGGEIQRISSMKGAGYLGVSAPAALWPDWGQCPHQDQHLHSALAELSWFCSVMMQLHWFQTQVQTDLRDPSNKPQICIWGSCSASEPLCPAKNARALCWILLNVQPRGRGWWTQQSRKQLLLFCSQI